MPLTIEQALNEIPVQNRHNSAHPGKNQPPLHPHHPHFYPMDNILGNVHS